MKDRTKFLRICFVIGAVTDGLAIIPMLFPDIRSHLLGGSVSSHSPEYRYAMGIGASLMAGWTTLLIWAALRPIERRGVLVFTIFPVVAGIASALVYGIQKDMAELRRTIPVLVHLSFISVLYLYAYAKTRDTSVRTHNQAL